MSAFRRNSGKYGWQHQLRYAINEYFSESDIKELCFDLEIDFESLAGQSKPEKVIELITLFFRNGKIEDLIDYCSDFRPNVSWDKIKSAATKDSQLFKPETFSAIYESESSGEQAPYLETVLSIKRNVRFLFGFFVLFGISISIYFFVQKSSQNNIENTITSATINQPNISEATNTPSPQRPLLHSLPQQPTLQHRNRNPL